MTMAATNSNSKLDLTPSQKIPFVRGGGDIEHIAGNGPDAYKRLQYILNVGPTGLKTEVPKNEAVFGPNGEILDFTAEGKARIEAHEKAVNANTAPKEVAKQQEAVPVVTAEGPITFNRPKAPKISFKGETPVMSAAEIKAEMAQTPQNPNYRPNAA